MVAITVILAAIIAAAVFAIPSEIHRAPVVAISATQIPNNTILITLQGGLDLNKLVWINGFVNEDSTACNSGAGLSTIYVGATMHCTGATDNKDHLIIIGKFFDQTEQVLVDSYI